MGLFFSKTTESYESTLSHEFMCNSLTKWYGEPSRYAHCIYLDDLSRSFISEVVQWRVNTQFSDDKRSTYAELMLKHTPRNKTRKLSYRSADFFKNEINFYDKILPGLLEFQNSKDISGRFDNHARLCFTHYDGENDIICLKDERIDGYNTSKTINIEHGKLILRTLARFHALSFVLKTKYPDKYKLLTNGITETLYSARFWSWYKKLWSKICSAAINAIENEYPDSIYMKKIKEFAVPRRFKELIKAVNKENSVILHGDCRLNNYLFKYANEKPIDIKMLDFQQVRCGNPVLDVSSVIISDSLLLKSHDELLKYYYGNFATSVIELGGDPDVYTVELFMKDVKNYSFFGLAFNLQATCTEMTHQEITDIVCDEWITGDVNKYKKVDIADAFDFTNLKKEQRLHLANSIVHCVNNGYI